jgi:hypothetical protein
MSLKHTPEGSARWLIAVGKREMAWKIGETLQRQSLTAYFYDEGFDGDDLETGIQYGATNGWLIIDPVNNEFPSAMLTLTELGDLA